MKLILLAALAATTPAFAQDMQAQSTTMPAPADPAGGYQPAQPAMSGPMTPGVTPQYVQAPTPDQAFPAPPPLAHYPVCKRGQFDKCVEPNSPK